MHSRLGVSVNQPSIPSVYFLAVSRVPVCCFGDLLFIILVFKGFILPFISVSMCDRQHGEDRAAWIHGFGGMID